jgi:4-amino-4-deoxy-L-arabinose transferase-like glycosyltransferase
MVLAADHVVSVPTSAEGIPERTPRWGRPACIALATVAALCYTWSINNDPLEPYYAAAVRSMAASWHDFVFGAFDPAGTITIDKLPGALWPQALSVRLLGAHTWAMVLPQVLEGVGTVLVLYRAVNRLAGPVAAIVAALVLAASPATVALDRGNISDTLLVLLLVLAADAVSASLTSGRQRPLLLAGVWVGLAFQAKMLEAWLVLPALGAAYLLAAPSTALRRARSVVTFAALAGAVSLVWMSAVTLTPAPDRPYVDGSHHNSEFEQVFVYDGLGRFGEQTPLQLLAGQSLGVTMVTTGPPGWKRLVTGSLGRDTGWLLPAALAAGALGFLSRGKRPRGDGVRAATVLWGSWLAVLLVAFSIATTINSYYTAALSPPVAALVGIGVVTAWATRDRLISRAIVGVVVAASTAFAAWLMPTSGTGLPRWLLPIVVCAGAAATLGVVASIPAMAWPRGERGRLGCQLRRDAVAMAALCGALGAMLTVPAIASGSVVLHGEGAFDTPFESASSARDIDNQQTVTLAGVRRSLPGLERARLGAPDLLATETSAIASMFIYASGQEVLPIGGFTGTVPAPTLRQLRTDIANGQFHLVLAGRSRDPRIEWIVTHCQYLGRSVGALSSYFCVPADARVRSKLHGS